jgi:hypothetical protein
MITIESLEQLASQIENDNAAEHARLQRLCRAMVRILAGRQPDLFERFATSMTDEAGHCDNSYPPSVALHYGTSAPHLIELLDNETSDVPTSRGYYHTWCRQTDDLGLFVGRDGTWYGCDEHGTGAVGQYAAHPGDRDRDILINWVRIEPTLEQLRIAEPYLRRLLAQFLEAAA